MYVYYFLSWLFINRLQQQLNNLRYHKSGNLIFHNILCMDFETELTNQNSTEFCNFMIIQIVSFKNFVLYFSLLFCNFYNNVIDFQNQKIFGKYSDNGISSSTLFCLFKHLITVLSEYCFYISTCKILLIHCLNIIWL